MRNSSLLIIVLLSIMGCVRSAGEEAGSGAVNLSSYDVLPVFVDLYWDTAGGRLYLSIESFDEDLLYQS